MTELPSPPPPGRPAVPPLPSEAPGRSLPASPAGPSPSGIEEAPSPSRRPLVVGLLLVAALVGAVIAVWAWLAAPAVCEGRNVRSDRFGYCLAAPEGWRTADVPDPATDQLLRPDGPTTLTIQAVRTPADLETFASLVREAQSDEELRPGEVAPASVDGVDALSWDLELRADRGPIHARTVVFVSDGVGWRVQFADLADAFAEHEAELDAILGSWRFL